MLIHLIDGTSASPVEDMTRVNAELSLFDSALAHKPQLVVVNKIDLPQVQARLAEIKEAFGSAGTAAFFISAATSEGVSELMAEVMKMLDQLTRLRQEGGAKMPVKVFRPQPRALGTRVRKEGDTFVVAVPELERIVARTDIASPGVSRQLKRHLTRLGVSKALEKAGVKPGNRIRCGSIEWEWE